MAFDSYAVVTGKKDIRKRAEACYAAALSLFAISGSACCTNMAPFTVNGEPCGGLDPWANHQDWALYYAWKYYVREKLS